MLPLRAPVAATILWIAFAQYVVGFAHYAGKEARDARFELNGGRAGNPGFSLAQLISTTGDNEFKPPNARDARGPCPALNAMANHGYLNRNGYISFGECVNATSTVFNLDRDLARLLCFLGQSTSGDLDLQTWSIGNTTQMAISPGPMSAIARLIANQGHGMAQSHLRFEGDASFAQNDWKTLLDKDVSSINLEYFRSFWDSMSRNKTYDDLYLFVNHRTNRFDASIMNNPCFFNSPLGGSFITTSMYAFAARMFRNHSEEIPDGTLTRPVLAPFFGVSVTENGTLEAGPAGYETIPDNWYRRATPYSLSDLVTKDLPRFFEADARPFYMGGNTRGPMSFASIDLSDLTSGAYSSDKLLEGNNFACFYYRHMQSAVQAKLQRSISSTYGELGRSVGAVVDAIFEPLVGGAGGLASCAEAQSRNIAEYTQFCGVTGQTGQVL